MLQYKGYTGSVEQPDLEVWFGAVQGIRDTVTYEGTTESELAKAFIDSVDDYLAMCAERCEEPEKPAAVVSAAPAPSASGDFATGGRRLGHKCWMPCPKRPTHRVTTLGADSQRREMGRGCLEHMTRFAASYSADQHPQVEELSND